MQVTKILIVLQVTGEATENQIVEALRRYAVRAMYVQRALYKLFSFSQTWMKPRKDIIQVITNHHSLYSDLL